MKKKKEKNIGETALYERLSHDDDNYGESNSIVHQKEMLEEYANKNGFTNIVHYTDDGWSGATFDRPAWNNLVEGVKDGKITTVIVKDLSRVGRDHLQVGFFTDMLFREKEVHFIAIGNGIDSDKQETSEFAPFLNIMNEWYVRDTSKKIKAVLKSRGMSGKAHTSNIPPYGYLKDPNDPNHWIVDEEAAVVVRKIYQLTIDGNGPYEIARKLSEEKIERPSYYLAQKGLGNHKSTADPDLKYAWKGHSVADLIARPEYYGCTVNFRTYKDSYKDKKTKHTDKDDWVIFENTQEPIIDKETWDLAQKLRKTTRRTDSIGVANPLTGKVFCADCGAPMYNHREREPRKQVYYTIKGERRERYAKKADCYECSTYNLSIARFDATCTCHSICTSVLNDLVLNTIKDVCSYVTLNEEDFINIVTSESGKQNEKMLASIHERITRNEQRKKELDQMVRKIYEDNISGRLSERHFEEMLDELEKEIDAIDESLERDHEDEDKINAETANVDKFLELTKKYTDFSELTPTLINEFVDKILVHQAVGVGAHRQVDIEIYLNFIGKFEVPHEEPELTDEEKEAERIRQDKLERKRASNRKYMAKSRPITKAYALRDKQLEEANKKTTKDSTEQAVPT